MHVLSRLEDKFIVRRCTWHGPRAAPLRLTRIALDGANSYFISEFCKHTFTGKYVNIDEQRVLDRAGTNWNKNFLLSVDAGRQDIRQLACT